MSAAPQRAAQPEPETFDLAAVAAQGPVVRIDYRPPCPTLRSELSHGAEGPGLLDVVRSLCRTLDAAPHRLAFEPDPARAGRYDWDAGAYVLVDGRRVARVAGVGDRWLQGGADCLAGRGWRPGLNREWAQPETLAQPAVEPRP